MPAPPDRGFEGLTRALVGAPRARCPKGKTEPAS
jgi:hypothetical protein